MFRAIEVDGLGMRGGENYSGKEGREGSENAKDPGGWARSKMRKGEACEPKASAIATGIGHAGVP